jgi:ABC-type uncharacterized transport system substrate-binding protein
VLFALKRLSLGLLLAAAAAGILLVSDWSQRRPRARALPRLALFQIASRQVLDDAARGVLEGLARSGFREGATLEVRRYNAEGDLPTANAIAREIVGGGFDAAVSVSTPALQALANANRDGKLLHVFCAVTDPFAAKVGLVPGNPLGHPRHLVGVGTFQPVRELFRLARRMRPGLKKVGTVWCPAESASEACLALARAEAAALGIELAEAQVDSSASVSEAARSLTARGVEALWLGGDNVVETAASSLVAAAREARIPFLANAPIHAEAGALAGLGADYVEVGRLAGDLAGRVLGGLDPATVRVENAVPTRLALNLAALEGLRENWTVPDDVLAEAAVVIERDGTRRPAPAPAAPSAGATAVPPAAPGATPAPPPPPARKANLQVVHFAESTMVEEAMKGLRAELPRLGLVEGRDVVLTERNAQGEMASLVAVLDAAAAARPDVLLVTSTPTLQATLQRVKGLPVVFNIVANPVLAGAGRSFSDHVPNVTGISTESDFAGMARAVRECLPGARRAGTLFNPGEANSVFNRDGTAKALAAVGIELVAVATSTPTEVPDAALALASRGLDAICQVNGNMHDSGFSGIAQAARTAKLPLFAYTSAQALTGGAAVAVARDYERAGADQARLAARVLRGENPATIPIQLVSRTVLVVNLEAAAALGMTVPPSLLSRADRVVGR